MIIGLIPLNHWFMARRGPRVLAFLDQGGDALYNDYTSGLKHVSYLGGPM